MERRTTRRWSHLVLTAVLVAAILFTPLRYDGSNRTFADEGSGVSDEPQAKNVLYLPLVSGPVGAPQIEITTPGPGWQVSGMQFFTVQPLVPSSVDRVTFRAGAQLLGADTTPADGFKLLFDASSFPNGKLTLNATAVGPGGESTAQVDVTVVGTPPSSALMGQSGGVLATASGSVLTFPPGSIPDGTTISVTDRTQAQVTAENGIDWEALGITFLGDQRIESSAPLSRPVQVSSAGFGNRVQPGQVVVNYTLLPDANGDGMDELVILNGATVAANGDVVSNPVPQVLVRSIQTVSSRSAAEQTVIGAPGSLLTVRLSGMNTGSLSGNVGIWKSLEDGATISIAGYVSMDPANLSGQIFKTIVPPLPPGDAELRLQNLSTGSTTAPIPVTILPAEPLIKPAVAIIEEFLADTLALWQETPAPTPFEAERIAQSSNHLRQAQTLFAEIANSDLTPAEQQILDAVALAIQKSSTYNVVGGTRDDGDSGYEPATTIGNAATDVGFYALVGGALAEKVGYRAAALAFGYVGAAATVISYAVLHCPSLNVSQCFGEAVSQLPDLPSICIPLFVPEGILTMGAGGVRPTGGDGCGNVVTIPDWLITPGAGTRSGQSLSDIIVKIFTGSQPFPISGNVDTGGYFYLPLIPAGEPFTALAINTENGKTRTQQGIGPETNEVAFLLFDFTDADEDHSLRPGQTISDAIDFTGAENVYVLPAASGQRFLFRLIATSGDLAARIQVFRPDGSSLCQHQPFVFPLVHEVCAFDGAGYYVVVISDSNDAETGDYQLFVQRSDQPADAQSSPYGSVRAGSTATGVGMAAYTFDGVSGDRLLARVARMGDALNPGIYIYRPDGSLLCQQFGTTPLVESQCTLDATGTHAVFVGDAFGQGSGGHQLFVQRLNAPVGAVAITDGQTRTATIDPAVEVDAYTFTGVSGEKVRVRMTQTGGALKPQFQVYRPDQTLLCQFTAAIGVVAESECTLDASGQHVILASDWQGVNTGSYELSIDFVSVR